MAEVATKFYQFRQNNSGGRFHRNDDVDTTVYIEAVDADHANARAEKIGIYFNGCSTGSDCSCCGDRWYRAGEFGSDDALATEDDIAVYRSNYSPKPYATGVVPLKVAAKDGGPLGTFDDDGIVIHRLDGKKIAYRGPASSTTN